MEKGQTRENTAVAKDNKESLTCKLPLHVDELADHEGAADERAREVAEVRLVLLANVRRLALGEPWGRGEGTRRVCERRDRHGVCLV